MKKKMFIGLLLFVFCLFISTDKTVFGEPAVHNPTGSVKITTDIKNNPNTNLVDLNTIVTRLAYIEDESGAKFFCLDADKWYPYDNYYSASEILNNPITSWLLKNYYYGNSVISNENEETRYAATQLAIWAITNPAKYADLAVVTNNQIIMDLIAEANTHANDLSAEEILKRAEVAINPLSQKFKLSDDGLRYLAQFNTIPNEYLASVDFFETDQFSFSYNNQNITKNVSMEDSQEGKIISIDKNFLNSIYKAGTPLKVDLTSLIKGSFFVGVAYYTSNSNFQPLGAVENLTLEKKLAASAEIYLDKGQLKINKIDNLTKQPLTGATFTLKDINQTVIDSKTTDDNGEIIFDNLDFGQYLLEETIAPIGYENNKQQFTVTIDEKTPDFIYQLTVENKKQEEKMGDIKLIKTDDKTKNQLEGAEFALLDKDKKVLETKITDKNGEISFSKLPFGSYYLKETKAPDGFVLDNTLHSVVINEKTPGLVQQITLTNKKQDVLLGGIKLIKTDDKTKNRLEGAEFALLDKDKKVLETKITDKNGEISFSKLAFGSYYLKETKAPNGFVLDNTLHSVIINEKTPNLLQVITLSNKKKETSLGAIKITKQAKNSNKRLRDAEFTLSDDKKQTIEVKVTDKNGELIFSNLPLGTYYLKETKAPKDYLLDNKIYEIKLTDNLPELTYQLTVTNQLSPTTTITPKTPKRVSKFTSTVVKQLPQTGEELLNQVLMTLLGITMVYYALIFRKHH
ncbi:SpaA isopeptide-forming pilin-related protein [Vagococcus sp.]|uniref:SpaA isopeptide-forming pilin-related protein n=1 Tax=Vagococcus sp. TaxID=1933889 RepID=UPI002FC94C0E